MTKKELIDYIYWCQLNNRPCPRCNSMGTLSCLDIDSGKSFYAYTCPCLKNLILPYEQTNDDMMTGYDEHDYHDGTIQQPEITEYGEHEFIYETEQPPEIDGNYDYCPYDNEITFKPESFENNSQFIKEYNKAVSYYSKKCHNCGKPDGVDSRDPQCTADPPYKFRCKYCGHSLRTHPEYGVGMDYDMATFGLTWIYISDRRVLIVKPNPFSIRSK